ncbi:MAG: hypothetical protein LQ352_007038, partial [Teloschistes flavicans]
MMHDHISSLDAEERQKIFEGSHTIRNLTKSIRSTPSKSSLWIERAQELNQIGYADLAVGDAWKAIELNHLRMQTTHEIGAKLGVEATKALLVAILEDQALAYASLAVFLLLLEDHAELIELCDEGMVLYGDAMQQIFSALRTEAVQGQLASRSFDGCLDSSATTLYTQYYGEGEYELALQSAHSRFLAYPFMPPEYLSRQSNDIGQSELLFQENSTSCQLLSSSVQKGNGSYDDIFGVFATRAIQAGEILLEDSTVFGACSVSASAPSSLPSESPVNGIRARRLCENCYGTTASAIPAPCCNNTYYCSTHCRDTAQAHYHKVLCGQDFTWLFDDCKRLPKSVAGNGPLWLRILAVCVQSGVHPLAHPALARLTPNYVPVGRKWSFVNMVKHPSLILRQLGVNVFKDERYDAWVLHTIWARVLNNQSLERTCPLLDLDLDHANSNPNNNNSNGKRYDIRAINPMYSFFNHSCAPSATWEPLQRDPSPADAGGCMGGTTK